MRKQKAAATKPLAKMRSFQLTLFVVFAAFLESNGLPVGEDASCEVSYRGKCVDQIKYSLHRNTISEIKSVTLYKELNGKKATIGHCDWVNYFSCEAVPGYTWNQTDSTFCVSVNSSTTCHNATFTIAINGQKIVPCEAAQTHSDLEQSGSSQKVQQKNDTGCQDDKTRGPDDGSKQISKSVARNCQNNIPEDTDTKSDDHKNTIIIGISCGLVAICLVTLVVVYIICRKRRKRGNSQTQPNEEENPCLNEKSQSVHQEQINPKPPPGKKIKCFC